MTGLAMAIFLVLMVGGYLMADGILWVAGKQTLSQWVIAESKKSLTFAVGVLLFIIIAAVLLILHFNLPEILGSWLQQS